MKTIEDLTPQAYPEKYSQNIFTKGNKEYDLELEKVISEINNLKVTRKKKYKLVLLQFPDGLKPYATAVVDYLEEKLNSSDGRKNKVDFLIWLGDCFGACDTPILGKELEKEIDLVIQFGHNKMMPSY